MKVAIVILNWNTVGFLQSFLPGLLTSVRKVEGAEVFVADNASTDGSYEMMQKSFPTVRTLRFETNLGFTGGYNKAFEEVNKGPDAPEYFLLINSDIEVTHNWLQPLIDHMDADMQCGACAPKLHSWQEKDMFEYAGAAGGYIDRYGYPFCRGRILKRLEKDYGQYNTPADVFWATGACLMVRSKAFKEVGKLDNRFFAHMEEIDMCWKMQLKGWKITIVPESIVYHVGGGTLPASSPFKLFLNYRNNLLMLDNNLAFTFAADELKKGNSLENAASKGISKANKRIFIRKCLDMLSASVYLATFRIENFMSVWKAHKEYRKMTHRPTHEEVLSHIQSFAGRINVKGIYRKWIIMESLLKGRNVFRCIRKKDFIDYS
ncbi:MAG: glycosyltransferase family 2 protein [Bacteroidales bacterium]|nr:glycosyltransferase family 2 protein [Bacteroidales bacterium]